MTLEKLQKKQIALVTHLPEDMALARKLIAQGILPETRVKIIQKGLFQGPIAIQLDAARIALCRDIASQIRVQPL